MNNKEQVLCDLQTIINQAELTSSPELFFPLLYEFAKIAILSPELRDTCQVIYNKEKKAKQSLEIFEIAALKELKMLEVKIRTYIENNSISNPLIKQQLDRFLDQLPKYSQPNRILLFPLEQVLFALIRDENVDLEDIANVFGKVSRIHDYKYITRENTFPAFDTWEKESFYHVQEKSTADWFSLNQIMVFLERYDCRHYDNLVNELSNAGHDISKLQDEHNHLIKYIYRNVPPPQNLFPSIEEYKQHMRRLVMSIKKTGIIDIPDAIKTYSYSYDLVTCELKITDNLPIKFLLNSNPAKLCAKITANKCKPLSFKTIYNDLKMSKDGNKIKDDLSELEKKKVRNLIKNINNRFTSKGLPPFLIIQNGKGSLSVKTILISTAYRPIQ